MWFGEYTMATLTGGLVRQALQAVLQTGLYEVLAPYLPVRRLLELRTRATVYTPLAVVWAMVSQALSAHDSDRAASGRVALWSGLPLSVGSGALCKGRGRLPIDVLRALVGEVAQGIEVLPDEVLPGRRILVLDGTSLNVCETPANRAFYGLASGQKEGCGVAQMAVDVLMDARSGAVVAYATAPWRTSEVVMAHGLREALRTGDVVVADRAYASYAFVADLAALGVDVVLRQHQRRRNRRPGSAVDWVETWSRPEVLHEQYEPAGLPASMAVRIVRVERTSRSTLTLNTTLSSDEASAPLVAWLYQQRWRIETQFGQLKTGQEAALLPARSPEMAERAAAAHLLAFNLLCALRYQVAREQGLEPWHVSLTGLRERVVARPTVVMRRAEYRLWLSRAALANRIPERPGRSEPRRVKRRPTRYPALTRPRAELRATLRGGR